MTPQEQQQLAQVQALIDADPQIQALVARANAGPVRQRYGWVPIQQYIKANRPDIQQAITSLPSQGLGGSTWMPDERGRIVENSGVTWGSILRPAAIVGGGIGVNALVGPGAAAPGAVTGGGGGAAGGGGTGAGVAGGTAPVAGGTSAAYGPLAGGYGAASPGTVAVPGSLATSLPLSSSAIPAAGGLSTGAAYAPAGISGASGGGGALSGLSSFVQGNTAGVPNWLSLAGIGGNLFSGWQASRAANKAADQQAESAREALALAREMYGQTRADLAPYRDAGGQGLTALTSLLGLPGGAAASTGGGMAAGMGPSAPVPSTWHSLPAGATPTGNAVPRGAPAGTAPNFVTLRAPTGQMRAVPADQAAFYLARGASQV